MTHDRDALGPLGRPGRRPPRCPRPPAAWWSWPSAGRRARPPSPLAEVRLPEPALGRRPARRAARRWSAPSTCTPTTRPGCGTPAASPRPTCCGCAPATARTRPTPSSARPTTTRSPALVAWCGEHRVALVPFGGGTSVVGGLAARRDGLRRRGLARPGRLDRLLVGRRRVSMTAVLEAGLLGPRGRGAARPSTA